MTHVERLIELWLKDIETQKSWFNPEDRAIKLAIRGCICDLQNAIELDKSEQSSLPSSSLE